MLGKFRFKANSALTMAVAAGLTVSGFGMSVAPAMAKNSKGFVKVAKPIQGEIKRLDKLKEGGATVDQLKLEVAKIAPMLIAARASASTDDDKAAAGQYGITLGGFTNDAAMRAAGVKMLIDSGSLTPEQLPTYQFYLGNFSYESGDYVTAAPALKAALDGGYEHDALVPLMLRSYTKANMGAQGLAAAKSAFTARQAAGQIIPEEWLSRANVAAFNAKQGADAIVFSEMLVQQYPSDFNWLTATQITRSFGNFDRGAMLDLFRLMDRSGALDNDAKFVGSEYKEYIETADPRKNPGEVVALIDRGFAKGKLRTSDLTVKEARSNAYSRIASDKASLPALIREAGGSANGKTALLAGDVALNYGQSAQAAGMYQMAIQKGGIDTNVALTRLGIAQYDLGQGAAAKASFGKVTGARQPLAQLWSVQTKKLDKAPPQQTVAD